MNIGGGLGGTRRGGPEVNLKHSGREDNERERERYAREMAGSRSGRSVTMERDRERDYRDRDRERETRRPRSRDRERKRHRSKSYVLNIFIISTCIVDIIMHTMYNFTCIDNKCPFFGFLPYFLILSICLSILSYERHC